MNGLKPYLDDKNYYCVGIDVLKDALSMKKFIDINHPRLKRIVAMMENLEFEDNSFHAVFAHSTMHHSDNIYKVCYDVHRVLKKKGVFIIANEPYKSFLERKNKQMEKFIAMGHNDHLYALQDYLNAMKKAGFRKIRIVVPEYFFDIKPVKKHEVKSYKYFLSIILAPVLRLIIIRDIFRFFFPLLCRLFSLPIIIVGEK